ncbi:MAG: hypothetical protein IJA51_00320 [Oscillospiraceae bacterium]|nr:hypothetical protein [Oscillospiraceae bacterium]
MVREYTRRFLLCIAGLALYAFGNLWCIKAGDVGTNAWNTLALGISHVSDFSFGTSTFLVGFSIIFLDLICRGKLGFGTFLNALLIPIFSDWFLALGANIPTCQTMAGGIVVTLLAQMVLSFATIIYMSAALGCGPRDTMMVILGRKVPKVPIGIVKLVFESSAMILGVILGAPFGLGTILVMVLQASMFQLACTICRFEPRDLVHENLPDTLRRWKAGK